MNIDKIKEKVFHISKCPSPLWQEEVCREIASEGIDSLLVIDTEGGPFPSRQSAGLWCLFRPLSDPDSPHPAELVRIIDFIAYETRHARRVGVWIGCDSASSTLIEYICATERPSTEDRPLPDDPCCCQPYRKGCHGELVCHGTTIEAAKSIMASGQLLSKARLTEMPSDGLTIYAQDENVGDPPDYYEYVCLANGDCVAPDIVTAARRKNRFVSAQEADEDFYPAVRFYFDTMELHSHPGAEWDGINALKIRDAIDVAPHLTAIVIPEVDEKGEPIRINPHADFENRVIVLDHRQHNELTSWSTATFQAVKEYVSNQRILPTC